MSDRLADAKAKLGKTVDVAGRQVWYAVTDDDVRWLVAEVERQRVELQTQKHNSVAALRAAAEFAVEDEAKLKSDLAAERIENAHLREAFMVMERGYNLAAAVLEGAEVFSERQPLVCTDDGIIEDPSQLAIVVDRAAWQAWVARGRQR